VTHGGAQWWQSAKIIWVDIVKDRNNLFKHANVQVDPSVLGFRPDLGLLQYTVRDATRRLVEFKCRLQPGWVPDKGMHQRLWRDSDGNLAPDTGLQQLEAKHKRSFAEMMQRGFPTGGNGNGGSNRITTADQMAAYDTVWMHDSLARQHVRQRVADKEATAAGSQPTALCLQQDLQHVTTTAVDDTEDPLLRGLPPGRLIRAADKRLPRPLRVFGWQLLHAAVMVGSNRVYAAKNMQDLLRCCCPHPHCQLGQQQPQQQQQLQQQPPGQGSAGAIPQQQQYQQQEQGQREVRRALGVQEQQQQPQAAMQPCHSRVREGVREGEAACISSSSRWCRIRTGISLSPSLTSSCSALLRWLYRPGLQVCGRGYSLVQ
jgi:hypothetical protein